MRRSVDEQQIELPPVRPWDIAPRDAQDLMSRPFFSLGETPPVRPIAFRRGDPTIPVEPTHQYDMATIWNAEFLIWAASRIVDARDRGLRTSRLMAPKLHEIPAYFRTRGDRPVNDGPSGQRSSPITQSMRAVIQRARNNTSNSRPIRAERWVNARLTDNRSRQKCRFSARSTIDVSQVLRGCIKIAALEHSIAIADMLHDPLRKIFPRSKRSQP